MNNALTPEMAEKEVTSWLDHKKINTRIRESKKDSIDSLIGHFEDGVLVLNEDFTITQSLQFPIGDSLKTITYKPRLSGKDINAVKVKNGKGFDTDAYVMDRICAMTGVNRELLLNLDTVDRAVCDSLAVFFI
jgi:kynureninase